MSVHWGGVAGMIFFYLLILAIGLWASRRNRGSSDTERIMVADRDFGWFIGLFTLIGDSIFFFFFFFFFIQSSQFSLNHDLENNVGDFYCVIGASLRVYGDNA